MDKVIFFNEVRPLFFGKLSPTQVSGMENILTAWDTWGIPNTNFLAKVLATAKWETGGAMVPVKETQRPSDIQPPSDATVIKRLDTAFAKDQLTWVKKPYWREGWFGRGLVQLTHADNYRGNIRMEVLKEFQCDIFTHPALTLRPDISAFILVKGMVNGWFTGKALDDFIDYVDESDEEDLKEYMGARKIINGVDRAREIGLLALGFERALKKAGYAQPMPPVDVAPPMGDISATPTVLPQVGQSVEDPPMSIPAWAIGAGIIGIIIVLAVASIF